MTTHYPADPCMKPHTVDDTIRERLMSVLLRKALPILWREELSTRTNADLRDLIRQIEGITRD